ARCEGAATPGTRAAGSTLALTARQREIAVLAAQGLGNAEIGARLDLSVRTVANHLQRVYEQAGVRRRQDLAVALGDS
ncbi:MAG TPA: helix-turn-helix transcriptional regulator, partial [Acidimicrobiales bacterium]